MDIGVYLFMTEPEFSSFIELARSKGHDVIYDERWKQWRRVAASEALPETFQDMLRERSNGSHSTYLCVDDLGGEHDPDKVSPPKLVCAYFGGRAGDTLYQTKITMRSNHPPTIAFVKAARKWLHSISRTGVDVLSLPDGSSRQRDKHIRYTEGAREAVGRGAVLRQGGVKYVGFELAGGDAADLRAEGGRAGARAHELRSDVTAVLRRPDTLTLSCPPPTASVPFSR